MVVLLTIVLKNFFEMWETSPDKWTIRVDHGYGYHQDFEDWRKGLYTDWNVSKTIILNCNEEIGATYCRNLCYMKVFGQKGLRMENHKQFMNNNNITENLIKNFINMNMQ